MARAYADRPGFLGEIHRGTVLPNAYATTAATTHEARTVRMALESGNVRAVDISPPLEDEAIRIPVSSAEKRNVLDPTSALIMAVPAGEPLVGPAACNRTLPIYDGVVRFDLTMTYTVHPQCLGHRIRWAGFGLRGSLQADCRPSL